MAETLAALKPDSKPNVIDLVREAGIDVSDWSRPSGAASNNPKYCYEWCFEDGERTLLNIWFENMAERDGKIVQDLNMRERASSETGPRRRRALDFDAAVQRAFGEGREVRAMILHRPVEGTGEATGRKLDPQSWHVRSYDKGTGAFTLARGTGAAPKVGVYDPATQEFNEGQQRERLARHRKRERKARAAKIAQALEQGDGRLHCEVPGCGFDFLAVYGEAGRGYAHVHHLVQLSDLPETGGTVRLSDLAIVCANCHAMIHRGGGCRPMEGLILSGEP